MADVADSLSSIRRHVFEDRDVAWSELQAALEADFAGHPALQALLANPEKTPKYGRDDPAGDELAAWLLRELDRAFAEHPTVRGGHYRVGYWTMTNHAAFGRLLHATPDGRPFQRSFASGITPVSAAARGLNETITSTAGLPVERVTNGMALNLKLPPVSDDDTPAAARERAELVARVAAYFEPRRANPLGGMELQFNLIDQRVLEQVKAGSAVADDLLVRVSGYTAYYKDLNARMQQEIIDRTMYDLTSGHVVAGLRYKFGSPADGAPGPAARAAGETTAETDAGRGEPKP